MEKKFRSINFKIWRIMAIVVIIFFGTVLTANFTVMRTMKSRFIFERLKETSEIIKDYKSSSSLENKYIGLPQALNFRINKTSKGYDIIVDPFIMELNRKKEKDVKIFEKITNSIVKNKNETGVIKEDKKLIFYYVDWGEYKKNNSYDSGTVFFSLLPRRNKFELDLFLGIFVLFITSFFISRVISKKIAAPIQKLKLFAEEISERNWNAKVPKTDYDEIGILTRALEEMRDSLKLYEERDRQFLQSTSHDLKTPVMVIKGYAQSMIDGIKINSEKSGAEVIKTEAERLERKINQLLKLNTLSHSLEYNKNKECVRIDRILKNLISKFKIIKPEINWIVNLKEVEIQGDSEALLIAFENIIENQLRFAVNSISIEMKQGKKNEIIISNDGPHFEVEDPNILFETYTKDKSGKFGLGLSIVKQIVKSHKGTIEAHNTREGVEFKILV
ncbi:sensor histidine kinase [Fusobacterium sp. MFO224]|uniref:sensor histidine kinase n=1 Tax=Fusobacterium sp. MFO224 TaxID=3378070 RepID=UPI00385433E6